MLRVIAVAYKRPIRLRMLIDCFLMQTQKRWELNIIHDGFPPDDIKDVLSLYKDSRIKFSYTDEVNGHWGHPNRKIALKKIAVSHQEYVLMTNDDNYYVPMFVELVLKEGRAKDVGMIYCDTVHSYHNYNVLKTEVREGHIDMGSFAVRLDVAKKIDFRHIHFSADGTYAVECANYCRLRHLRIVHIAKPLFVHN